MQIIDVNDRLRCHLIKYYKRRSFKNAAIVQVCDIAQIAKYFLADISLEYYDPSRRKIVFSDRLISCSINSEGFGIPQTKLEWNCSQIKDRKARFQAIVVQMRG